MEILKDVSIDWIGKKWWFLGLSWVLALAGIVGWFIRGGLAYGIDFTGGTVVYIKFKDPPNLDAIRRALKPEAVGTTIIQRFDRPELNSVQVRMQRVYQAGEDVDSSQRALRKFLQESFDQANLNSTKPDFNSNNVGLDLLHKGLLDADPDGLKTKEKTLQETEAHYKAVATSLLDYRNRVRDGLVASLDELSKAPGVSGAVVQYMKNNFYAGVFAIKGVESVGAVVGADLRRRAGLAVGLSFLGMLVYIGFRFKPIYGVAAIVALLHDVVITHRAVCADPERDFADRDSGAADARRLLGQRHDRGFRQGQGEPPAPAEGIPVPGYSTRVSTRHCRGPS